MSTWTVTVHVSRRYYGNKTKAEIFDNICWMSRNLLLPEPSRELLNCPKDELITKAMELHDQMPSEAEPA